MKNIKLTFLSLLIFVAGALLFLNVLLLDMTGKNLVSKVDFSAVSGVDVSKQVIQANRGNIYDVNGNILVNNMSVYKIIFILSDTHKKYVTDENGNKVMVPDYVVDKKATTEAICEILQADKDYVLKRLSSDKYQVEIGNYGNNLSSDTKAAIEALGLPGIIFEVSTKRFYANSPFASHLIGYVDNALIDKVDTLVGKSGIEKELNDKLTGINGIKEYYTDVSGSIVAGGSISTTNCIDGYDVTLTLNTLIQQSLDQCLESMMNISKKVKKAWGIVMNAKDGSILAYDSFPTYNQNTKTIEDYNDYCASLPYEPGSVIKSFTYAAAIDLGKFNQDEQFNSNNYYVAAGNVLKRTTKDQSNLVIHNSMNKQYGMTTYYRAYINSYNVGTVTLLEEKIGKSNFVKYMENFGFYKKVDVLGINEGSNYGSYDYSNPFSLACASFGSGMSCNALQIMQAYTAFCNGGTMIKPYIISKITDPMTNEVVYQGKREEVGQPISASTATTMLGLMSEVVNSGYHISAKSLRIDNVNVGCKTGTAPVALANGGYGEENIHSVIIAMPIEDPQVLIYVCYQDDVETQRNFKFINTMERVIASVLKLGSTNDNEDEDNIREIINMPNFINHSIDYVKRKNEELNLSLITIGDGNTVIRQYPNPEINVISQQRVFLLTSNEDITMPNMLGWSRSEIMAFWDLTGISMQINGYGYVVNQNIEQGTVINSSSIITVDLN